MTYPPSRDQAFTDGHGIMSRMKPTPEINILDRAMYEATTPSTPNPIFGLHRANLIGNGFRELDRFLSLIVDARLRAEAGSFLDDDTRRIISRGL